MKETNKEREENQIGKSIIILIENGKMTLIFNRRNTILRRK